jgi:hypothetical protein
MNEKSLMGIGRGASTVTSQHPGILEQCFEHVGSPLKMDPAGYLLMLRPEARKDSKHEPYRLKAT